jgi:hypothetical protein
MPTYIRRILITLITAMMIFALAAQAEQGAAPGGNASAAPQGQGDQQSAHAQQQLRRLALLAQYLNLSDDQKRQWMRIQKETMQNVHAARKDDSLNEEQMQQRIKGIHAEQRRQLMALLTPQQQEALKKWWDEQKQKQQNRGPDAAPDSAAGPAGSKDDDFFAGMVQDPEPASQQNRAQNEDKKAPPRN